MIAILCIVAYLVSVGFFWCLFRVSANADRMERHLHD